MCGPPPASVARNLPLDFCQQLVFILKGQPLHPIGRFAHACVVALQGVVVALQVFGDVSPRAFRGLRALSRQVKLGEQVVRGIVQAPEIVHSLAARGVGKSQTVEVGFGHATIDVA